jgi:Fic-DOC domain mobile mystery protein B
MDDLAIGGPGSTPLSYEEREGLIPKWVATRADLNEVEQQNLVEGFAKRRWRHPTVDGVLDHLALRQLHRDLLGEVWEWAGSYRLTGKNLGVEPAQIAVQTMGLTEDARLWVAEGSGVPPDESACWFHHRLVTIHLFPNGNGWHARAATDLLMQARGLEPLTWARGDIGSEGEIRHRYIEALRAADRGDYGPLVEFVRS